MIEAKGPGYAKLLQSKYFFEDVLPERWRRQAGRQDRASGTRNLDWFFAEVAAAARAKDVFRDKGLDRIKVMTVPAVIP
jgi:hypothetical protein